MKISIYIASTILLICLLGSYSIMVKYIRYLRKEREQVVKDIDVILVSILYGAPVILIMELTFKEVRIEDQSKKYRMLISSIILSIIQIVSIVLLIHYGIIELASNNQETTNLISIYAL